MLHSCMDVDLKKQPTRLYLNEPYEVSVCNLISGVRLSFSFNQKNCCIRNPCYACYLIRAFYLEYWQKCLAPLAAGCRSCSLDPPEILYVLLQRSSRVMSSDLSLWTRMRCRERWGGQDGGKLSSSTSISPWGVSCFSFHPLFESYHFLGFIAEKWHRFSRW